MGTPFGAWLMNHKEMADELESGKAKKDPDVLGYLFTSDVC